MEEITRKLSDKHEQLKGE